MNTSPNGSINRNDDRYFDPARCKAFYKNYLKPRR